MLPAYMRKYAQATDASHHISIPMVKRGVVDFAISGDWTPAAGDVRLSKDGGAWANITTLPTFDNAAGNGSSGMWVFQLASGELTCKQLRVVISDATTKAVEDNAFIVETVGNGSAMYPSDPTADNTDQESRFLAASEAIVKGVVGNGTNSTTVISISGGAGACDPTPTKADQFKGRIILFARNTTTAGLRGQGAPISTNNTTSLTLASSDLLTDAPVEGDIFTIT